MGSLKCLLPEKIHCVISWVSSLIWNVIENNPKWPICNCGKGSAFLPAFSCQTCCWNCFLTYEVTTQLLFIFVYRLKYFFLPLNLHRIFECVCVSLVKLFQQIYCFLFFTIKKSYLLQEFWVSKVFFMLTKPIFIWTKIQ